MNTEVMFSSKTDDWATPQDFFDKLDAEFNFTLDPCADDNNHKCEKYFTKKENGLLQDWGGAKLFFAIHLMVEKCTSGLRSVITKGAKKTQLLCCLYQQEQIQNTSMILSYIEQR